MKKAALWNYLENKATKGQLKPKFADGQNVNRKVDYKKIAETAQEFEDFKNNNPEGFKKYKIETGQWELGVFNWRKENHKGKNYLASYFVKKEKDDKGNIITKKIKYIAPIDTKKINLEEKLYGLFEVKNKKEINKDFTIIFGEVVEMEKAKERK